MVTTIGGPRVLLRQLRETMAEPLASQARLDKIVDLIAENMRADVCSFYVLRDDGALELFATHGLKAESVHLTTLRLGEGLVGLIAAEAEPLSLDDAPSHPAFAYRPETGEDRYNSFLGVPVLRAGQTLGVLVVQNGDHRHYGEDETEAMLTTATILAEMIATSDFDNLIKPGSDIDLRRPRMFNGVSFTDGIALGKVVLHDPRVVVTNFIAEDTEAEKQRLDAALETMRVSIDAMLDHGDMAGGSDHREILETYRMFANDRGWVNRLSEAIANGLSAEAAVERVQNDTRARMLRQTDPYIRDRLHDLDDLANRLLRVLTNTSQPAQRELPDNAILVARNMGPAELLEYEPQEIARRRARRGRGHRPCRHRRPSRWASWRWARPSPSSPCPKPATTSSSTVLPARCICAPRPMSSRPMWTRSASRPRGAPITPRSRTSPASRATAWKSPCCTIRAWWPTCPCWTIPARWGSGCSAPNCSS